MNRIVVDTNVFWNRDALHALMANPFEVIVPSIVLAERVRQMKAHHQDIRILYERLDLLDWTVEPLGREEALRYAPDLVDRQVWKAHARDALIAGHIRPGDALWTANAKDFIAIGVPPEQIQRI